MELDRRRAVILATFLIVPFLIFRFVLGFSPNTNLNVAGYNIHHLFIGLVLILIGGLPLVVLRGRHRLLSVATGVFATGLSLTLDEWVYLIATDGSDASYLLPVSLWGAIIMIGIACMYLTVLVVAAHPLRSQSREQTV